MNKARHTSKQRLKNAGRNPTRTTTPETQSDGYQGNSKLRYSDYAQGTTGYDTMFNKLKIGENDLCACGLAPQNTEHVLQRCTLLSDLRTEIWPTNGTLAQKLYGTKQELTSTTDFIEASGLTI